MLKAVRIGGMLAALSGCAAPAPQSCSPGFGSPLLLFDLYFGAAIPRRGDLTEPEWRQFIDDTIAVNLPVGFTVFDAGGGWMNPVTHKTTREATKVLLAALPDTPASFDAIDRIRSAYQLRFQQQRVGMTVEHVCGSF